LQRRSTCLYNLTIPLKLYIYALSWHSFQKSGAGRHLPHENTGFFEPKAYFFVPKITRADDLGRVVIPKEIRRTLRIREGDPSQMTLKNWQEFCIALLEFAKRIGLE